VYSRMSGLVHCFSHDLSTDLTQPLALHDALPISIPPNLYNNVFSLNAITQDNITISSYNLSGQNLTLNLPQALPAGSATTLVMRSEEHTSELQSRENLVCRLLLEKKNHLS